MYSHRTAKRFSFLLLDVDEDFLQEYICICRWPAGVAGNWNGQTDVHGTLRVCSKSLFFEADDARTPVVRLPIAKVESLEPAGPKTFTLCSLAAVKMKANNQDQPYEIERSNGGYHWRFTLPNRNIDDVISLIMRQMLLKDDVNQLRQQAWDQLEQFQFDTSRLVKRFAERIEREMPVTQLTPLVRQPGKLVITSTRIYFQPLNNVSGTGQVLTHPLAAVAAVVRRRFSLKPIGLEVFFHDPNSMGDEMEDQLPQNLWDAPSALFVFQTKESRETIAEHLFNHVGSENLGGQILETQGKWVMKVMRAWQLGRLSNFDYLMYLNLAAGRSFNDLTQWPVFPWIISDYASPVIDLDDPSVYRDLSKPVGALNPERLEMLRRRYKEMPSGDGMPPKFLYGTHYSTPGYVMFWLLRSAPGRVLQLQNGKFDSPDRLFYSVAAAWESVNQNPADVKELIPEFYLPNADFLVNKSNLALGKRQNGKHVNDVELPPWASGPSDFLAKNRAALESPQVSSQLHKWIDLIFGCKQRGESAVEADNLFYYLSYEGGIDIEQVTDTMERRAIESQINEFGQTPMQIFTQPHPPKRKILKAPDPDTVFHSTPSLQHSGGIRAHNDLTRSAHDATNESLAIALFSAVRSVASTESIDASSLLEGVEEITNLPVQAAVATEPITADQGKTNDNTVSKAGPYATVLDQWSFLTTGRLPRKHAEGPNPMTHNLRESVTNGVKGINTGLKALVGQFKGLAPNQPSVPTGGTCVWSDWLPHKLQQKFSLRFSPGGINAVAASSAAGGTLYCAGQNATLRLVSMSTGLQMRSTRLEATSGSGLPLSALALFSTKDNPTAQPLVLAGSYDNSVYAYSAEFGRQEGSFSAHDSAISQLKLMNKSQMKLATASWDCSAKIWSLEEGRHPWSSEEIWPFIEVADHESGIWAMDVSPDENLLATGTDEGDIAIWDLRNPSDAIWRTKHSSDYIGGLQFTPDQQNLVVSSADGRLSLLSMSKSGKEVVSAKYESPLRCCRTDGYYCVAGSEDGHIVVWNVGQQIGLQGGNPNDPIAGPDGLFEPIQCVSGSAVNTLFLDSISERGDSQLWVVTGHEEGEVVLFKGLSHK